MDQEAGRILVVDDDENILKVIRLRLESRGFSVVTAEDTEDALKAVETEYFDLALIDLKLKKESGIDLMQEMHELNPELPAIILTAYGSIDTAVKAMKKGAYTYITKPFDYTELLNQVNKCIDNTKTRVKIRRLETRVKEKYGFDRIIGKSEAMQEVLSKVAQAADSDATVCIQGESGTGKELIAKTLHAASYRKDGPFVAINCAAVPESLLESELFGYEAGAFTGANRKKTGLFIKANDGSLFLDEISEMPVSMQAKLLRALEEREFYPLGAGQTVQMDTRVITASNRNLEEAVQNGRFREDLYYRIHVIPIVLPPLRERKEDITLLARYFLDRFAKKMNKNIKGFTPVALQKMSLHPWPGNVRELENSIEYAVVMSEMDVISEDLLFQTRTKDKEGILSLKDAKDAFERDYLLQLIEFTEGNVSLAAKLAGKYRADIYELLKKHEVNPQDYRKKV